MISRCRYLFALHQASVRFAKVNPLFSNNVKRFYSLQPVFHAEAEKGSCEEEKETDKGDLNHFDISKSTMTKLVANGIKTFFPVQSSTYNAIFEGNDVIVQARTGTGKTLAFTLPVIERLSSENLSERGRVPLVLALAPTRELAMQIYQEVEKFKPNNVQVSCFYGGSSYEKQEGELRRGVDFLVGTPGRIADLIQRGVLDLTKLKHVILDEADRMMDMGFQDDVEEILKHSYTSARKPQTLLFSATVPPWLQQNSKKYLSSNLRVFDLIGEDKNKGATTVQHKVLKCSYWERPLLIKDVIQLYSGKFGKTIIFTSTKQEANELSVESSIHDSQVLHGDISQNQREITLQGFRNGKFNCLIATDVAARGLDIPEVDLVIQTEPPNDIDYYIHRAGRTGRAGRSGVCVVFYKPGQESDIAAVEKRTGVTFEKITPPNPEEIVSSCADDAIRSLEKVNSEVISFFMKPAKELIEKKGAEEALAAALAYMSGTTELANRSLLTSRKGYTTYLMKQPVLLRNPTLIWNVLRRYFDEEFITSIKGMRMCQDKLGCVFDVPTEKVAVIKDVWKGDRYATLEKVSKLPDLIEYSAPKEYGSETLSLKKNAYRNPDYGGSYNNRANNSYKQNLSDYGDNYNNREKNFSKRNDRNSYNKSNSRKISQNDTEFKDKRYNSDQHFKDLD